ncbi:helix-turn-helix domain-containing protein [Paenibacillus assamensis]|uniref:helix-turn-helix domain-containing protein n=1 Tax=Paenibacillus assamensis TaxID=311244 RepID=UPI00041EC38A|nr:helix-turn-helix domain-containing protein [Paenibacillus assamensis]
MKKIKKGYFKSPNDIFEIGLNPYQLSVYLYLTRCSNNSTTAFPSFSTIASKCGMSERKAKQVVKELTLLNLLKKENRKGTNGSNKSNIYEVIEPVRLPNEEFPKKELSVPKVGVNSSQNGNFTSASDTQGSESSAQYKQLGYKQPINIKDNNIYIDLPINDHLYLQIYNSYFFLNKEKHHMRVTEEQLALIMENIYRLEECGIEKEEFEEGVQEHFDTLPKKNNGNFLAFINTFPRRFEVAYEGMYDR